MSGSSNIEWTDATWNPTRGCSMASGSNSPECGGCYNCYAARQALRHAGPGGAYEGLVKLTPHGPRWTGKVVEGDMEAPLHWRKARRVFVDSMSDLFHESLPDETIDRAFAVMALCPQHTFQVLTKRAERMQGYWHSRSAGSVGREARIVYWMEKISEHGFGYAFDGIPDFPLLNVWLGVSCENQPTADARIPHLLCTPAAVRFLSLEPMLGRMDIRKWLATGLLHWVIIGGESGPGARPMDLAWARDMIAQCRAAGTPVFMKQTGSNPREETEAAEFVWKPKDRKGGDMEEWPKWARVREWPLLLG